MIVDLHKKYTCKFAPTAENFIMYKKSLCKNRKSDDLEKIVMRTNLINKK